MKRRMILFAALCVLLTSCAARDRQEDTRAEALQGRYAELAGCAARVTEELPRGEETLRYVLDVERGAEETRVTVSEPAELSGVTATVRRKDGTLRLEFDGTVLDAGSANPKVSALNAVDLVLRAAAEGYITERSTERFEDAEALRLCFETEYEGETLFCTAFFDAGDAPLYAELEQNGEILAYLEFTSFSFYDTIS